LIEAAMRSDCLFLGGMFLTVYLLSYLLNLKTVLRLVSHLPNTDKNV